MNISDYLKESNQTQMEFARLLGVSQGTVGYWLHNKLPTLERAIQIEKITGGKIRCEELRPDVDWAYLRGTDSATNDNAGGDVLPESGLVDPDVTPAAPVECASGDPRHGIDRRQPDQRKADRRKESV